MNIFLHSEHFLGHKSLSHIEAKILVFPPVSFFHSKHWFLAEYMAIWCGSGQYLSNLPLVEVPFKRRGIPFFHLCPSCLLEFGHDNWSSGGHFGQWETEHVHVKVSKVRKELGKGVLREKDKVAYVTLRLTLESTQQETPNCPRLTASNTLLNRKLASDMTITSYATSWGWSPPTP